MRTVSGGDEFGGEFAHWSRCLPRLALEGMLHRCGGAAQGAITLG
jgi:hypothetical protein